MRSTPDLPTDPLGSLGKPIRPEAPKPLDVVKPFEIGEIAPKGLVITDKPDPIVTEGSADEWEGLCASELNAVLKDVADKLRDRPPVLAVLDLDRAVTVSKSAEDEIREVVEQSLLDVYSRALLGCI